MKVFGFLVVAITVLAAGCASPSAQGPNSDPLPSPSQPAASAAEPSADVPAEPNDEARPSQTFGGSYVVASAQGAGVGQTVTAVSGASQFQVKPAARRLVATATWDDPTDAVQFSFCLGVDRVGIIGCTEGTSPLQIELDGEETPAGSWIPMVSNTYDPTLQGGVAASLQVDWTASVDY